MLLHIVLVERCRVPAISLVAIAYLLYEAAEQHWNNLIQIDAGLHAKDRSAAQRFLQASGNLHLALHAHLPVPWLTSLHLRISLPAASSQWLLCSLPVVTLSICL